MQKIKPLCDISYELIYSKFNKTNMDSFLNEIENLVIVEYFLAVAHVFKRQQQNI